jgi:predicted transcriptional regulator of viral defense system
MKNSQAVERERLKVALQKTGVIRSRELVQLGISRTTLQRMVEEGELYRASRGVYRLAEGPVSGHASLVEVHKRIPKGVVCLLSALAFHEIGTQLPRAVWIAVDFKAWKPVVKGLPVRIVRFSGSALTEGIERHEVEGVLLPIYSPAKTVADCFKYRNKIGIDVAVEALRDGWRDKRFTVDELMRYAAIDRVRTVMTPYAESLV